MTNFIPQDKITDIQHSADIIQIISDYVRLKRSGKNFIGLCPFHSEKTPSFTVNPEKKLFKCFGCGEGGTVFNFIMKHECVDFVEAVKLVANRANIDLSYLENKKNYYSTTEKQQLLNLTDIAAKYYHNNLCQRECGKIARDYLARRRINNQSVRNFCLGYAPDDWCSLIKICKEQGISEELLEKVGLVVARKEGNGYYDRFRNRLMFPIFNARKQVVGFGGRTLDDSLPKYLNSPETVLFNKGNNLYGIEVAKNAIIKKNKVILMEGYTDVIMAHQHGVDWSVAVLGTAISKQQLHQLRQYCNQVILLLDSDVAGLRSSDRNLDIFIEEEFDIKIVQLPKDYDPCDFLVEKGVESFLAYINIAKDFFSFKVEMATSKWDMSTISGKTNAINDVVSTAMKMPDIIKRNLLIKQIAEEMSIDEEALRAHIKKFNKQSYNSDNKQTAEQRIDASSRVEQELLYLMLSNNDHILTVMKEINTEEFTDASYSKIVRMIFETYQKHNIVRGEDMLHLLHDAQLAKELTNIITKEEFQNIKNHEDRLGACIQFFKQRNAKKEINITKKKMMEMVKIGGNEQDIVLLLNEFHKKNRHIHSMKNKL
ncbi:MAG: DNA primase [Planctomycetes bacterium RIFCSPHIGHO2_02_FULL_38_41]|nr:MAG: DNA primase [Planctomycetes bacterium RIFCSPHIGHO2_02_FULL_38_41]